MFGLVAWLRWRFGEKGREKVKTENAEEDERREMRRKYAAGCELDGQRKDAEVVAM